MDKIIFNRKLCRESLESYIFSFPSNNNISGCIGRLFFFRDPSAIFDAIRTIIINTIKRHADWLCSHVIKESREVIPARIVSNTTTAIVVISDMFFVIAPLFHARPRSICIPVDSTNPFGPFFWLCATTTNTFPVSQRDAKDFSFSTTRALAQVINGLLSSRSFNDSPFTEYHSSEVYV